MWQWIIKAFVAVGGPGFVFNKLLELVKSLFKKPEIIPPKQTIPDPLPPDFRKIDLWYPDADYSIHHKEQGEYEKGYPKGAVVHATAGRDETDQDAVDTIQWGKDKGYAFFMIAPSGKIYQTLALNKWGNHCGKSAWPGLGENLSNQLVGIEIACAGKLESHSGAGLYKSWFGKEYLDLDGTPQDQVRYVENAAWGCPTGHYKMFTNEQEESLLKLLFWLYKNNPSVFSFDRVVGHHEVSPDRKSDPGGSLSMPMRELRKKLKSFIITN